MSLLTPMFSCFFVASNLKKVQRLVQHIGWYSLSESWECVLTFLLLFLRLKGTATSIFWEPPFFLQNLYSALHAYVPPILQSQIPFQTWHLVGESVIWFDSQNKPDLKRHRKSAMLFPSGHFGVWPFLRNTKSYFRFISNWHQRWMKNVAKSGDVLRFHQHVHQ